MDQTDPSNSNPDATSSDPAPSANAADAQQAAYSGAVGAQDSFEVSEPYGGHDDSFTSPANTSLAARVPRNALVLIAALAVAVIAGLAAFYFLYWTSPQRVLLGGVVKFAESKSGSFEGLLNATGTPTGGDAKDTGGTVQVNYKGSYDFNQKGSEKLGLTLDGNLDMGPAGKYEMAGEARYLDQTLYGQITKVPENEWVDLSGFQNMWIKGDLKDQKGPGGKTISDYLVMDKEQIKQLKKSAQTNKVVKKIESKKAEKIDGESSRHYQVLLSKDGTQKFIIDAYKIVSKTDMPETERKALEESLKGMKDGGNPLDIWVSKKTGALKKITQHSDTTENNLKTVVDASVTFKGLGKAMSVEAPQNALTTKELEKEAETDSDGDGLVDLEERLYKSDLKKTDSDGDGNSDGAEVSRGFNPAGPGKLPEKKMGQRPKDYLQNPSSGGSQPAARLL